MQCNILSRARAWVDELVRREIYSVLQPSTSTKIRQEQINRANDKPKVYYVIHWYFAKFKNRWAYYLHIHEISKVAQLASFLVVKSSSIKSLTLGDFINFNICCLSLSDVLI